MGIYKSKLWIEDIDTVLHYNPWIGELAGKSVLITGICGLIGSAMADIIIRYNETHDEPVNIIAAARSEKRVRNRFENFFERPYFYFVEYEATSPLMDMSLEVDYIIHGAGNSSPDMIQKEPVETMLGNFQGLNELFRYVNNHNVSRVVYISSSEVYGRKEGNEPYKEGQYGYIDLLNPRNAYSVGKCAAETLCASYIDEYGVDAVIVRPGHIYGPTAKPNDRHVSTQWAYAAACGENIVIKSDGANVRSYCYCLDAATAILMVMLRGQRKQAYNISNPASILSIRQMAEILAECAAVDLVAEIPTAEEMKRFNPMNNSALDSSELLNLGWSGCFDAENGFAHTVQILKESAFLNCSGELRGSGVEHDKKEKGISCSQRKY